jgi:TolA-binding protein
MKVEQDNTFDLLALARRGDLSGVEERRLREVLASSPEARALYEAGRAFDEQAPVLAGDDELVARIERQVQRRLDRAAGASRRRWVARACLLAALIATSAVAASVLTKSRGTETPAPTLQEPKPQAAAAEPGPLIAPVAPVVSEAVSESAPIPAAVASAPPQPRPKPAAPVSSAAPSAQTESVSAKSLFAAANRARVSGDAQQAIRLSRQLVAQFPDSSEAFTTHLSLGMLYLQEGQAGPALEEFRTYRKLGAPGTSAEPLWGESQALRQLGRVEEERATLAELLASYPQSAYASAARKRLANLR